MIILKWILKNWEKGSNDWGYLAEERNICSAVVSEVINFLFHKMQKIPWLNEEIFASQKGLCSMECVIKLLP